MTGWGFTDRPCVTLGNAVFRGLIGGTGAKQTIVQAIAKGTFIPSPHGKGRDHTEATRITTPEAATLQGYPATFQFAGGRTAIGLQIGNSVAPPMARAVLEQIWRTP